MLLHRGAAFPDRPRILVRLPNWLGDVVMSLPFLHELKANFPGCELGLIVKKGLDGMDKTFFPEGAQFFVFSKKEYKGLRGAWRFGRLLGEAQWDLFFCLPDSFSSACMAYATRAVRRIGYAKELRSVFLTDTFSKKTGLHRADLYRSLLYEFLGKPLPPRDGQVPFRAGGERSGLVVNLNSEAVSRRIPVEKAAAIVQALAEQTAAPITLVGGPADADHVAAVERLLPQQVAVRNMAGKTTLPELVGVISSARAMLSSDSGPAHLASMAGTPLVVLFGAGDERETGPAFSGYHQVLRLGALPCEPCRSNTCKLAAEPPCLTRLEVDRIVSAVATALEAPAG